MRNIIRFPRAKAALKNLLSNSRDFRYRHKFKVKASLAKVADFHARSTSMAAITPPPVVVRVHQAPARLDEGDEMKFTLWLGPLFIRWVARIEDVSVTGFTDRQLHGPFNHWVHRHTFEPVDETTTAVTDEIEFSLQRHPGWKLVGLVMKLNLPLLFAYRGWKTRRFLERQQKRQLRSGSHAAGEAIDR
jgi:ligand-binding SRPBCC domain-containing protein